MQCCEDIAMVFVHLMTRQSDVALVLCVPQSDEECVPVLWWYKIVSLIAHFNPSSVKPSFLGVLMCAPPSRSKDMLCGQSKQLRNCLAMNSFVVCGHGGLLDGLGEGGVAMAGAPNVLC